MIPLLKAARGTFQFKEFKVDIRLTGILEVYPKIELLLFVY
jgi:hypothetical protein